MSNQDKWIRRISIGINVSLVTLPFLAAFVLSIHFDANPLIPIWILIVWVVGLAEIKPGDLTK